MAFGTITSTSNTFGSVDGTVVGAIPGTLSGSVGVPGPAGPTGPQGPAGQGVPAGGTAGQFLTKIDGTNYNTDWTTVNLSAYAVKANNLSDLTNASTARNNLSLGPTNTVAFRTVNLAGTSGSFSTTASMSGVGNAPVFSFNNPEVVDGDTITRQAFTVNKDGISHLNYTAYDFGVPDDGFRMSYDAATGKFLVDQIVDAGSGGGVVAAGYLKPDEMEVSAVVSGVLSYINLDADAAEINVYRGTDYTTIQYNGITLNDGGNNLLITPSGITFPDASVQTIAFPGFNNAALTGNSTAVTAALGDNDTSIATTAFVQQELLSGTANARNLEVEVRNQSGSTMAAGTIVYVSGATGNKPLITKAQANNDANSAQTIGFVKTSIANNGTGYVIVRGVLENIDTSALSEGVQLYLSPSTAGTWTTTKPSAPQHLVYVGVVIRSHPTLGTILVAVQNGYELHELHDVALSSEANNDLLVYELSTDLWKNKSFSALGLLTSADAASTYQTQAGMSSYAPLASPTFSGTPSLPTGTTGVTQSVNDNSTKLVTTAGLLDMLSDCTWSAPPISTTTTATSGTGAAYTNVPPDLGYLNGPNVNTAGFCQKGIQMFARSNSSYGFNYTKEMRIACKMAANWNGTFTGITYTLIQRLGNSGNGALAGVGFGISINMATKVLSILAHNGTTLTTKTTSWAVPFAGIASVDFMVKHDGTGTVYAYADGVLIDSTTGMSTATTSANTSMFAAVEINSAGGTSTANAIGYISNLRTFVAHG